MDVNQRGNKTTLLLAGNAVISGAAKLLTTQQKILQCVIPAGFSAVTAKVQGSNDGASWVDMQSFTASGQVVNTDPFRMVRGNITALTGGGAAAFNIPATRYTSLVPITGGTLSASEHEFFINAGICYELTTTAMAVGDWILFIEVGSPWNGVAMPVIDEGSGSCLVFDLESYQTAQNKLTNETISLITAAVTLTVAQ